MHKVEVPNIRTEQELAQFINSYEQDLEKLLEKMRRLSFKQLVDKVIIPELAELKKEFAIIAADPQFEELISLWLDKVKDPLLKKRLTLYNQASIPEKVSLHPQVMELTSELSNAMLTYQYMIGDDKSDLGTIKDILRNSPDPELRRKAWYGKHAQSEELAPRLLELIRLRNDLSKEQGFNTYADLIFYRDGLSLPQVKEMLTELTKASDPIYQQILNEGQAKLGLETIEPWDIMYLLEQMGDIDKTNFPKEKIEYQLQKWGKAHGANLEELGIQMVATDIPYNGLCMSLTNREIKIITNPTDGYSSYETMFHELGHAYHRAFNEQQGILKPESQPLTEGIAEIFGYITRHPEWLKEMGIHPEEIIDIRKRLIAPMFHFLRERTAFALAEYQIYENPSCDADAVLAQMEHEVLGVTHNTAPRWAASAWYINFPIYWQNYIIADMVASQIHHELDQRYGGLHGHPEAFEDVRKTYLAPGGSIDWQEKILNHTGAKLNADALVKDLEFYLK